MGTHRPHPAEATLNLAGLKEGRGLSLGFPTHRHHPRLTHAGLFTWNCSRLLQPSMASQSRLGNLSDSAARWTLSSLEPQDPSLWARETGLRAGHPNTQTAILTSTAVSKSHVISHLQMEYVWAQGPPASSFRPRTYPGALTDLGPPRWENPEPPRASVSPTGIGFYVGLQCPVFSTGLVWTHKQPWGGQEGSDHPPPSR